jgi:hypothetical protein
MVATLHISAKLDLSHTICSLTFMDMRSHLVVLKHINPPADNACNINSVCHWLLHQSSPSLCNDELWRRYTGFTQEGFPPLICIHNCAPDYSAVRSCETPSITYFYSNEPEYVCMFSGTYSWAYRAEYTKTFHINRRMFMNMFVCFA